METKRFNTRGAARFLTETEGVNVRPGTLEVWRCIGKGPQYKKIHNRVFYEREALEVFAKGEPVLTRI